jgi:hypothetical protein
MSEVASLSGVRLKTAVVGELEPLERRFAAQRADVRDEVVGQVQLFGTSSP